MSCQAGTRLGAMRFGHELGTLSTQSVIQGAIAAQGAGYVPTPSKSHFNKLYVRGGRQVKDEAQRCVYSRPTSE